MIPCGIPYVSHGLKSLDENILSDDILRRNQVELVTDEVIGYEGKTITMRSGQSMAFRKLVLAAGSTPVVPRISGIDTPGVYTLTKSYDALVKLGEEVMSVARVLIVGGGYVGVELADEMAGLGKTVVVVEQMTSLLPKDFQRFDRPQEVVS